MVRARAWVFAAVTAAAVTTGGCGDAAKSGGDQGKSEDEPAAAEAKPEAKAKAKPEAKSEAETPAAKAKPKLSPIDQAWNINAEQLLEESKRARALAGLKKLVADGPSPQLGKVVVPALVKIWPDAPKYHLPFLELLRDAADPAAAPVWNLVLAGEESPDTERAQALALEGITASRASGSVDAVTKRLSALVDEPFRDAGEQAGARRKQLIEVLGEVGDPKATPVLIRVLEQEVSDQPVLVHRAAATALGRIRDPAAVDALLTITFRVPDTPTSTNVGERSKQALASIGAPSVPSVVKMLQGKHEGVRKLAKMHGLDPSMEVVAAASILGAIGHPDAVEPLLAAMPVAGCEGGTPDEDAPLTRGVVATALGLIGDQRAVAPLCKCAKATGDPGDMFPIAEALGRIGGPDAVACLADVIKNGAYAETMVGSLDFVHQIRWEAARFGLLAADASQLKTIEAAVADAAKNARVAMEVKDWQPGFDAAAECEDDLACWKGKLGDPAQPWIVREKAAYMVARGSKGDAAAALELATAFSVRDPDARVSMALLTASMLGHGTTRCPACAAQLEDIMDQEKTALAVTYQLSVLTARQTVAKLRE